MKTAFARRIAFGSVVVALVAIAHPAHAADWPQWRGPQRTGISQERGLLGTWTDAGPKLLWQMQDLGDGYSTPAVVGDKLYLISNQGMENEYVQARSTSDGQILWTTRIGNVGPNRGPQYPGSRSTTTVDGDVLYALGSDGDLACLDVATGGAKWRKNLRTDFGGEPGQWAYSESPLVDGDHLICTPGGADATLLALNKKTGEVVWKSPLAEADQAGYASAIVVNAAGIKQYVQFLQKGLVGVDAKTGKFLWRYARTAQGSPANIPTPVAFKDFVFSGASRSGGGLVQLKSDAGGVTAEQVYFQQKLPTSIGGAVELDGYLFGTTTQGMVCAEATTGDVKWQERGIGPSSVCFADGRLYLHGENGDAALVGPSPEGYRERGRFTPPNPPERGQSKAWAYPVVANGRLYLRELGSLWCYDVRDPAAK